MRNCPGFAASAILGADTTILQMFGVSISLSRILNISFPNSVINMQSTNVGI